MSVPSIRGRLAITPTLFLLACCVAAVSDPLPFLRLQEVQDIRPTAYKANLSLDPAKADFSGSIEIQLDIAKPTSTIWLNASDIQVQKATLQKDGRTLDPAVKSVNDFVAFHFTSELAEGPAVLSIRYTGKIRDPQPQGIFEAEDHGSKYLFTQFEATDARDAFPCFDEPSYKTPWQLSLTIPATEKAVSNTPEESSKVNGDTRTIQFEQTKPLPSYLIAFAVGPFEFIPAGEAGRNHVPIRIVVPKGRTEEGKFAAEVTARILTKLENYFDIPYPYQKCDQVVLLKADFGAMENAGMVTYEPSVLLAKPSEDTEVRQREYVLVAAHELAHQWFGDLVTLQWWNDTWLNEAFASWMEQKIRREWNPDWNAAEDVAELQSAMTVDTLPAARKIRQDIASPGDIDNAFDGITYEKGAAVIEMFEHWMGPDVFRKGIQNYLTRYAFKTANTDDLMAQLQAVTTEDVRPAFLSFLDQPGIPMVQVAEKCDGGIAVLQAEQHRLVALGTTGTPDSMWRIPVCVRGAHGESCHLMTQRTENWKLAGTACGEWLEANAGESGYYRVSYGDPLLTRLLSGDAEHRLDAPERAGLIADATAEALTAHQPFSAALPLVPRFAADPDPSVLQMDLDLALSVRGASAKGESGRGDILPSQYLPAYQRFLASSFGDRARTLGWIGKPTDSYAQLRARSYLVRSFTVFSGDKQLAQQAQSLTDGWLNGHSAMTAATVADVIKTDAAFATAPQVERLRKILAKTTDAQTKSNLLRALRYVRDPAAVKADMSAFLSQEIPDDTGSVLLLVLPTDATRMLPLEFVKTRFDSLEKVMPFFTRPTLPEVGTSFCDSSSRDELNAFFGPRADQIPGTRRILDQTLNRIDSCIALRTAQESGLATFFGGQ